MAAGKAMTAREAQARAQAALVGACYDDDDDDAAGAAANKHE